MAIELTSPLEKPPPVTERFPAALRRRFSLLRWEAFALTWLIYVAYYLVRKNFDGVKPGMVEDGYTKDQVAVIDSTFLACYAIGQFLAGTLGDWFGTKRVVIGGMALSVAANVVFGFAHPVPILVAALAVNGLAQSCGFPLCCKLIATWFPASTRGRASSWFLTSYTLGDIGSKALTGALMKSPGWRYAFFFPAGIVTGVIVLLLLRLKDSPRSAGLPDVADFHGEAEPPVNMNMEVEKPAFGREALDLLRLPGMWTISSTYFLVKLVRYTLLGWSNVFLFQELAYSPSDSTLATIPLVVGGVLGTLAIGYASDKLFQTRRVPPMVFSMLALSILIVCYAQLGPDQRTAVIILFLLMGFFVYAVDSMLSATCAMDLGSSRAAGSAAGIINGFGSIGAILSSYVGARVSAMFGWTWA